MPWFQDTPLSIVADQHTLAAVAEKLARAPAIGVDTESDSFHHYQEKVCLLQFSDLEEDYIVDPLALGGDLSPLGPVFADARIPKIFHGADYDIVCLKRDFGFQIKNVFDTMISAQQLGVERVGLADLIALFFGIELDKRFQRHDWAARPLLAEHIEYARGDTHWLLALREILRRRLRRTGRLSRVEEECRLLEQREWEGRRFDPDGYLRIKTRGINLDPAGKRVLRRLYLYRDIQARSLDRPAFKVIPDPVLVELACARPRSESELDRLFPRAKGAMKRRHTDAFLDAVRLGLEDDFPIPPSRPRRSAGPPGRVTGRTAERALLELKEWRNAVIDRSENKNPVSIVSNNTLKNIARARPTSLDALALVPEVRQWQVEAYGAQILAVLDAVLPASSSAPDLSEQAGRGERRRRGARAVREGAQSGDESDTE